MIDEKLKYSLALSFLKKLCRKEKRNFVVSPLSLGTAFAMLSAGLKGETKTEILQLLGALDEAKLHSMHSDLMSREGLPLKIANKFLADQHCVIKPEFDSLLKEKYESEVESVDFAENATEIETRVNAWVATRTDDMITKLLPEGTLDGTTALVILNAIYFKGSWLQEFDPIPGAKDFVLRNGTKIRSSFITKSSTHFEYSETEKLRVVKIPYQEAGFYMLVAIPKSENEHIDELIADMQLENFINAIRNPERPCRGKVILSMPKFKIEYTFDELQNSLRELGVDKIFVPDVADFGSMFSKVNQSPYVGSIIHKAVVEIDEKGTTAAAATSMVISVNSLPPPPVVVELNRPFCFLIMSADNLVCFAGICAQP